MTHQSRPSTKVKSQRSGAQRSGSQHSGSRRSDTICHPFSACLGIALLAFGIFFNTPVRAITPGEQAQLQATMHSEINHRLLNGKFLDLDPVTGQITELTPAKTHPKILRFGKHFILCTDFKNAKGDSVNIDFYITRKDASYIVFKTATNDRRVLKKLMQQGHVTSAN